jgi:hypothetical protein
MMPDGHSREERVNTMSEALRLALDVANEGAGTLSDFLKKINVEPASEPGESAQRATAVESDQRTLAMRTGHLANDALSIALDVALAAKSGMEEDGGKRDDNLRKLSELLGFAGSMFVETTNMAVGSSAGKPAIDRARQVTVEVAAGEQAPQSVWVVNRGTAPITGAAVRILGNGDHGLSITLEKESLNLAPRSREQIRLVVTGPVGLDPGSFIDALLVVDKVASIVVRTIVKAPGSTGTGAP